MLVGDVVQTELVHVHPDANLFEAAEKMLAHHIETLLVFDGDHFLGVMGLRDLFTAPIPAHYGNSILRHDDETQLLNIWKTTPVGYLMNEKAITVNEDITLLRALELMVNTGRHPLPVMRGGRVVGTISRMDIIRVLLAQPRNSA